MRSPSFSWTRSTILLGCCAALLAPVFPESATPQEARLSADPVPLRRLLIAPERVPAELAKVANGVLKKLSHEEFEAKLKAAAEAGESLKNPPRLTETTYSATLNGTALEGNGEWKLFNPRPKGILSLPDINLALKKKDKVQFTRGPADAILGDLDGKTLGLLVNNPGHDSVVFAWTARGDLDPDGRLRFHLKVPPSPVASLDLTLPANYLVRVLSSGQAILSRREKEGADKKNSRWVVRFSGQTEVNLLIYRTDSSLPLVLSHLEAEQVLTPGRLTAKLKYHVEILHNIARKLYFECDRALRPFNVRVPNTDLKWRLHEAGSSRFLVIELREPKLNPEQPLPPVSIDCQAALPVDGAWTSPGLRLVKVLPWGTSAPDEEEKAEILADARLVSAFPRGETLTLQIHPEVQLAGWKAGSFRLTRSEMRADRTRVLALTGNDRSRPGGHVRSQGFDCLARQYTWWQIGPRGSTLTSHIRYEVARGQVFQLRLGIPIGWEVDQLQLGPDGRQPRSWTPLAEKNRTLVLVDLERALQPRAPAQLSIRLRSAIGSSVPPQGKPLAFPDVEPLDASWRAGALAISVNPLYRATILGPSVPPTAPDQLTTEKPPWESQPVSFYFPFRSQIPYRGGEGAGPPHPAVTGTLTLRPHAARIRAGCETDVTLSPDRAAVEIRLHLQPEVGSPKVIDYYVASPLAGPWSWKTIRGTNYVRHVAPYLPEILPLGIGQPWTTARFLARPHRGRWWRMTLARPLTEALTLKASFSALDRLQQVPLVSLPAGDALDGEVSLYLAGTDLADLKTPGLRESAPRPRAVEPAGPENESPAPWRSYRYGHGLSSGGDESNRPALTFKCRPAAAGQSAKELIDQCRLTTYVEASGRMLHHFSFQALAWRDRTLEVHLPEGAELRAVKAYGRWLPLPAQTSGPKGTVVKLPVASGISRHPFELVYISRQGGLLGGLWSRLSAPLPILQVKKVLTIQRVWCLAPGVIPLAQDELRRLPGPDSGSGFPSVESLFRMASAGPASPLGKQQTQHQALLDAEAALRGQARAGMNWRLGEALSRLVFEHLKDRGTLVLDVQALQAAGLSPASPILTPLKPGSGPGASPLWKAWGLVQDSPCRGVPLLTTRQQVEKWQGGSQLSPTPSASVAKAVREAAVTGHDSSGRFRTVVDWLEGIGAQTRLEGGIPSFGILDGAGGSSRAGWTSWEPLAGAEEEDVLWIVREETGPVAGLALALVLLLAARGVRRSLSRRWQFRLLVVWLAGAGIALLWLPPALRDLAWWPGLTGSGLAAIWYLWSTVHSRTRAGSSSPSRGSHSRPSTQVGAALLILIGLGGLVGQAAAPAPHTVLIVRDPKAPTKLSALIAPELDDLLGRLAERGVKGLRGAVLLSAEYRGTVNGGVADVEADFQVYCFSKEATLTLPLGNVVLKPRGPLQEPALFAGKPAYPVAIKGQIGFAVPLPLEVDKPDIYTLEMRFAVPITATENERNLQMTIPSLAQSRFTLDLPMGIHLAGSSAGAALHAAWLARDNPSQKNDLHAETGFGAQRVSLGSRRLVTHLGRVGNVHIQWREPEAKTRPSLQVQEMYLWDLRKADSTLSCILQYEVAQAAISRLTLGLAEGIEVRSVEVSRAAPPDGRPAPRLLKNWRLTGKEGNRALQVEFQRPATGNILLILELVPRLPAGSEGLPLFLPRLPPDVKPLQGYLGYRVDGQKANPEHQNLGVTSINPMAFAQKWRQAIRKADDPGLPTLAYSFSRKSEGPAGLRITLPPPPLQARQEIVWRAGLRHADVRAQAKLSFATDSSMPIEWEVPGVTVAEISGPDVGDWTQTGARVQVWLKGPVTQTTIDLGGWLLFPGGKPGLRKLSLPALRFPAASTQETVVGVAAASGLALEPKNLRSLTRMSEPANPGLLAGCPWVYVAQGPSYGADFEVQPAHANVRSLTWVEARDRQLVFTSILEYQVTRGELRSLRMRLHGWPGDKVVLEAPGVLQAVETQPSPSERIWTLRLQPGIDKTYSLRLTGKIPLDSASTPLVPEVGDMSTEIEEVAVTRKERWLALVGPKLTAVGTPGLVPLNEVPVNLTLWKDVLRDQGERNLRAWTIATDPWQLRARHRPAPGKQQLHLLLNEQSAAVGDGSHWLHQAVYWLYLDGSADLRIDLPAGASALAVRVDGAEVVLTQTRPDQVRLSLAAGPRAVRVTWAYPGVQEALDRPDLTRPKLETGGSAIPAIPALWTLHVPAGYRAHAQIPSQEPARSSTGAERDLRRAEAQQRLISLLVQADRGEENNLVRAQLQAAQERFLWYWKRAQYKLEQAANQSSLVFSDGKPLAASLRKLHQQNAKLLDNPDFKALGSAARKRTRDGVFIPPPEELAAKPEGETALPLELPDRGTPTYWQASAKTAPVHLYLSTGEEEERELTLFRTGLILMVLLAAWVISFIPYLWTGLQKAWPEQIILAGWLVWCFLGLPFAGIIVMVVGGLARLIPLSVWVLGYLTRVTATVGPPAGGSAASS